MNLFVNRLKQVFIFLFFALIFINVNFAKADSHDELSENLKQSLTKVINENVSKDLQKAIAKYASVISKKLAEDEKEDERKKLLKSTQRLISIATGEADDWDSIYDIIRELAIIINII